jgi:3-hydroxyacyl-CoA dehydrogenase
VDKVLTDFGFAMGIFAVQDLAGNDVGYNSLKSQLEQATRDRRLSALTVRLCDLGRLGQKTGRGWYRYQKGERTPIPDPEVNELVEAESAARGITRRQITPHEILTRCLYSMINEGARLLENGVALRSSDIDIVYVTGYGFPARRGGPMYYADSIGLRTIHDEIVRQRRLHPGWWEPAPLLTRLAAESKCFAGI